MTQFFSFILRPFENGNAYGGLIFISVITGAVMLFLFKLTSNQEAMKAVKTRIGAYFLEMRLYKDDVSAVMNSQRRILGANLSYMKLALIPAVVMIVPVILIMVQLNLRYVTDGLMPGDTAMIKVKVAEGTDVMREGVRLSTGPGIEKASPAVRIASLGEADWKIRIKDRGIHDIVVSGASGEMTLPVFSTDRIVPVFTKFKKSSILETIFNPGAPRIPSTMPLESIEIKYPEKSFNWGFFSLSWMWSFLIISMLFGVVLKFIFKVE
ncbi:MAG: hypothetical protein PVH52_00255 [bacterium]